ETEYDAFGRTKAQRINITQFADGSTDRSQARETTYHYDQLRRQVRTTFVDGTFTETHYDSQGRVTAEVDPLGLTKSYEHDGLGRLSAVVLPQVADSNNSGALTHPRYQYGYDARGNQVFIRDALYGHATVDPASQRQTTMTYDERGNQLSRVLP